MIWHVTFSSSRLSCSFDSCSVEVNVVASDKAYDKKRDFATERVNESIEAQPTGPTKDQNLKIQRCFKLQDLASTFWDMTFGHICWFASLIAAWSLTAVAWAWWTTKRHTTGKFHKLSLKTFWVFRARTLPEHKMLQCLAWSNDLAIIQYKVHQRTSTYHTVSQVSWKTVKQSCNAVGLGSTKILKHQNGSKNRIKSTKSDQGSKKNGGNVWKKKTCWAGPRTWCAWSAWTSSVASRSSSKKRVVQNSSFFFTHKSKKICKNL